MRNRRVKDGANASSLKTQKNRFATDQIGKDSVKTRFEG